MITHNIYSPIAPPCTEEVFETIVSSKGAKIERIVSLGQATPVGEWLQQDSSEWVILLSGSACMRFEGWAEEVTLKPGDYLNIPGGTRHRVERTDESVATVWLAVHYS